MPKKRKRTAQVREPARNRALEDRTDWARVLAKTDADIARDIADDPDASAWTDEDFARAVWMEPLVKTPISLRIDPDILEFFKEKGPGYQSRMNAVLRAYMEKAKRTPQR